MTSATGLSRWRPRNMVVPVLFLASTCAAFGSGFVTVAPNRLVSGRAIGLFAAAAPALSVAIAACWLALLALSAAPPRRALHRAAAALAGVLLVLVLAAAGNAANAGVAGASALTRVSLGAAFWVIFGASALAIIDGLQRADAGPVERLAVAAVIAVAIGLMAHAGMFDALSLAHEYRIRHDIFSGALIRHITLVAAALGPAILIGFPLGVAAVRRPHWQGSLFATLNLLQTIPSIALFGLLLVPLSALATAVPAIGALGIGGIGPAPAIIALTLYALLPVARNSVAGIAGVDPGVLDAARGMGMTQRQRFWRIEIPLAAPLLLAGLRIVMVQSIGLAVVAALIGAGGLGTFVFEGLGQYAADLVLLGALPAIVLALAADFLLQTLSALLARR
ncbi:MAG TPA: ABC transporter permease [Stellaceae bacterium]|nr:ABC transporter permease [Stellaceae bacterium]